MSEMILYHYYRSSCSWRVRWALELKNLPYQLEHIDLLAGEQNSANYREKNPSQAVPCLRVGDQYFSESLAIVEWLEERYPEGHALLPKTPEERIRARHLALVIVSGTQPLQNLVAQKYFSSNREKQLEYARYWISRGLKQYETILKNLPYGSFSMGATPTLPDLCLTPQCYNAERFGVDLKQTPLVQQIYQNCLKTKACRHTHPDIFAPK